MNAFYFGCWGRLGHYVWTPSSQHAYPKCPFVDAELDMRPFDWRTGKPNGLGFVPVDESETEGIWRLTHRDGWTLLGCWDRTMDARKNSKSVFIIEGTLTQTEAENCASRIFPQVWARVQKPFGGGK